jgi:hypothetical protein
MTDDPLKKESRLTYKQPGFLPFVMQTTVMRIGS